MSKTIDYIGRNAVSEKDNGLLTLAQELARYALKSFSLQVSEHADAVRLREICYAIMRTKPTQPAPVAQGANFMADATPMLSCTVCGKPMSYTCFNCGSTPECVVVQGTGQGGTQQAEMMEPIDDLVAQFSAALREKLITSEEKYGWQNGWLSNDWAEELRSDIRKHIEKGDPRDVAAYCAFAWHHGWSLAASLPPASVTGDQEMMIQCVWCDEEYESDPNIEQEHLIQCEVFQSLPVKETTPDGKTFVEYEPGILVERRRKAN